MSMAYVIVVIGGAVMVVFIYANTNSIYVVM